MPWQHDDIDVDYEYDPDSGLFRYREHDLLVPRQSGKTTLTFAKKAHRLAVMSRTLGPQRSMYTAQTRKAARKKLELDFADTLRRSPHFAEIRNPRDRPKRTTEWKISLNNGSESILFGVGNYLQIDAPSRTGQHGDTLDDSDIDEAFSHEDDTVEQATRPAMITRTNAQLWVVSTAGDRRSYYLWRKVLAGRAACESGEHGQVCYTEYSAPDDADPGDPNVWWATIPSLGYTVTEDTIRAEWEAAQRKGQEGVDLFCRAYLNMWPEVPVLDELSPEALPIERWLRMADPGAARGADVVFGVDVGSDRMAHVAVAWVRPDDRVQVMLADTGLSPLAAPGRIKELQAKWKGRVLLGGPAASLEGEIPGATLASAAEFAAACGRFDDMFRDDLLRHGNQDELNAAIRHAEWRTYGSSGAKVLQLRDAPLVGPLAAVVRAIHGLVFTKRMTIATPLVEPTRADRSEMDIATMTF